MHILYLWKGNVVIKVIHFKGCYPNFASFLVFVWLKFYQDQWICTTKLILIFIRIYKNCFSFIHDIHYVSKAWFFTAWYYEEKQWVAKHATEQSCISDYRNMGKSCSAPNCQKRGKKGCVTPFYRVPRNKDRKRCWLTFLCR